MRAVNAEHDEHTWLILNGKMKFIKYTMHEFSSQHRVYNGRNRAFGLRCQKSTFVKNVILR